MDHLFFRNNFQSNLQNLTPSIAEAAGIYLSPTMCKMWGAVCCRPQIKTTTRGTARCKPQDRSNSNATDQTPGMVRERKLPYDQPSTRIAKRSISEWTLRVQTLGPDSLGLSPGSAPYWL